MGRRGPPPKHPALKLLAGTDQPCRRTERLVQPTDSPVTCPAWLKGKARRFFLERAQVYRQRGIDVAGCEDMLAHYCALHCRLVEQWQRGETPQKGLLDTLKSYAAQFYDTPAVQFDRPPGNPDNPFSKHGRKQ